MYLGEYSDGEDMKRKSIKSVENPEKVWYSETEMQDRKEREK